MARQRRLAHAKHLIHVYQSYQRARKATLMHHARAYRRDASTLRAEQGQQLISLSDLSEISAMPLGSSDESNGSSDTSHGTLDSHCSSSACSLDTQSSSSEEITDSDSDTPGLMDSDVGWDSDGDGDGDGLDNSDLSDCDADDEGSSGEEDEDGRAVPS
jgi:hypothetical protein